MRNGLGTLALMGLLAAAGCAPWGEGCGADPLSEPLAADAIGPRAVEFYLPADRVAGLGAEMLEDLATQDADQLDLELPAVTAQLDAGPQVVTDPVRLSFSVARLDAVASQGGLLLEVELAPIEVGVGVSLFEQDQPIGQCTADLVIPARSAGLPIILAEDDQGAVGLQVDGSPRFTGPAIALAADGCQVDALDGVADEVAAALDAGLQEALPGLSGALLTTSGAALGVDVGGAGQLGEAFRFWLGADTGSTSLALQGTRLGLAGGFETQRDACVPPALGPTPPTQGEPAPFDDLLPESQQPYGLGVSVSRAYIEQALGAAHRAGLLCRRSGAGDVLGVELAGALPSLADLGQVDAVRAAVWPQGALQVTFGPADPEGQERLPRLVVSLPDLYLDVYARMDGADLRVLGLHGDISLEVVPRLDGHTLTLTLADAQVAGLEIEFAELVTEQAGELRSAAREIVTAVGAALIDTIGPIPLELPTSAGPELLEVRQSGEHVVLYF